MDQPGKVANPARGQLKREINIPLFPCVPENLVSRDGFIRPVPRQPVHLHTQAESVAYLRDSSLSVNQDNSPRRRYLNYIVYGFPWGVRNNIRKKPRSDIKNNFRRPSHGQLPHPSIIS